MLHSEIVSALRKGLVCLTATAAAGLAVRAGELAAPRSPAAPKVAEASNEGELAMKRFKIPQGMKTEVVAAEPHLANPVSFSIDEKGRIYVVETFRLHEGVTDIRGHMDWLDEDLAARTADDRLALMKRHSGDQFSSYSKASERIKLLVGTNTEGKITGSTVFAEGFNHPLDGIAAGVLARKGDVWFTDIPNLWHFKDTNNDGVADERKVLHYGYGVRVGFLGHDLHGLRFGPDGKIYYSIGDRGSSIKQDGKTVGYPDTGSVFRCNPDGSELEVFAFGLRNPQGLAFDEYGNLFTGDNNSDGGDQARWVYVVEGGDSGWRVGYQFIESPNSRGPWNSEKLWHPYWQGQAAYLVPPIANIANGPSGLAYYPGTGMPDQYKERFFLTDFRGGAGSGIHSIANKPRGAWFDLADRQNFIWECLPTDVNFGVDGGIYFSDWVQGWGMTGKGRIYRAFDAESVKKPIVQETKKLLAEGFEKTPSDRLVKLLAHQDMRVRQEAQFELADRGEKSLASLLDVALKGKHQLARIHAIWGVNQIAAAKRLGVVEKLAPLLKDGDAEVRAQAAKALGDRKVQSAAGALSAALRDASPRVRFFAAMSLGKLGSKSAVPAILDLLRENDNRDPYLRHAGSLALAWIGDVDSIVAAGSDKSAGARMGALLALRRLERAEIAMFLGDSDPLIVTEAARAINDVPISGAIPELAAVPVSKNLSEPALRRVVNANYRYGLPSTAQTLARVAAGGEAPEGLRAEAIHDLENWEHPSGRDRITGLWRPLAGSRDPKAASEALRSILKDVLASAPDPVRSAALKAVNHLQLAGYGADILAIARNSAASGPVKVEALRALHALSDAGLPDALAAAQTDKSEEVRKEAIRLRALLKPAGAAGQLATTLEKGSTGEKQSALAALGTLAGPEADGLLAQWLDNMKAGTVPKELLLDLLEAAAKRSAPQVKEKLAAYEASLPKADPLAEFRPALQGGNAAEGRKIFFERAEAACMRCHKIKGDGGDVGPDLSQVAGRKDREYMLESILLPNKQIAAGFETLIVTTKDGKAVAGILKSENDKQLVLNSPEDGLVTIVKANIASRDRGLSAMPEGMGMILSKQDLRNLIEFLGGLK